MLRVLKVPNVLWVLRVLGPAGVLVVAPAAPAAGQAPQDLVDHAEQAFAAGEIEASVAAYDRLAELVPDVAPVLWQRGIGLYELGRYEACAEQFAANFAVNPTDLENATWHFLCTARAESPDRALGALLDAGPDGRVMRAPIYEMLGGRLTPDELVAAAWMPIMEFYAHLYAGLYLEAIGQADAARPHLVRAAAAEYRDFGGFMNVVAQVHLARLED